MNADDPERRRGRRDRRHLRHEGRRHPSGIAERLYGDGSLWRKIYDANKMVIGPDKLGFDLTLKIPLPG
jgi:hypothetical protein